MKKPKTVNAAIKIDTSGISDMLKNMSSSLAAAAGSRMHALIEKAMKDEAEGVKRDAMMRVPIRTNALRSRPGGLFGSKADYMIIDDPSFGDPEMNGRPERLTVNRILEARRVFTDGGGSLNGAELWLSPDQSADMSTYTRSAVHEGSLVFGLIVRIDYDKGSMIPTPYVIEAPIKAEPGQNTGPTFHGWDWGTFDEGGSKVGDTIKVKKPTAFQPSGETYVTHDQADAYASHVLGDVARKRHSAFTKPDRAKAGSSSEVAVVVTPARFVEVPEDE